MRDFYRNIIPKSLEHNTFKLHTPRDFNRKTQTGHPQHMTCSRISVQYSPTVKSTQCFERFGALSIHNHP